MKKTIVLKVDQDNPDPKAILEAAKIIKSGGLVAFPTETVYGLGANALDDKAIERLCMAKNRPADKYYTLHISEACIVEQMCGPVMTGTVKAITDKFWPGPLTIVLRSKKGDTVGFRMPKNAIALGLISKAGVPLAAPSANLSGNKPPTSADEVLKELEGKIDMVLDGGKCDVGIESTVLDLTGSLPKILRQGAISAEKLGINLT